MRKMIAAVAAAALLSACASSGTKVEQSSIEKFQRGHTTFDEVIAALGRPSNVTTNADGRRVAVYTYAQYQTRPETFLPYIGGFVGGADAHATAVAFNFAPNGVLENYSTSETNTGVGLGLAAK